MSNTQTQNRSTVLFSVIAVLQNHGERLQQFTTSREFQQQISVSQSAAPWDPVGPISSAVRPRWTNQRAPLKCTDEIKTAVLKWDINGCGLVHRVTFIQIHIIWKLIRCVIHDKPRGKIRNKLVQSYEWKCSLHPSLSKPHMQTPEFDTLLC